MLGWRFRKDAVAEIEDVAARALCALQDVSSAPLDQLLRPEEDGRIEIALERDAIAHARARGVEIDAPVDAEDLGSGLGGGLDVTGRLAGVIDSRRGNPGRRAVGFALAL